jgi:hypothetical protein
VAGEKIRDPVFGELTKRTKGDGGWWADLTPKHKILLYFTVEDEGALAEILPMWYATYNSIRKNGWEHRLAVAGDLTSWIERHQGSETCESFARKLELNGCVLRENGGAELYYSSNGRLFDNVLLAWIAPDGQFDGAEEPLASE